MPKYNTNIKGTVRGLVQGNNQTIVMDGSGITSVNGHSKRDMERRYKWARSRGVADSTAREYAGASPRDESDWLD